MGKFELAAGETLEEIREQARTSPLYQRGDMVLVWVNEGDLYALEHSEAATLRAQLDVAREALGRIKSIEVRATEPWTHELAADVYSAELDRAQQIARTALAKLEEQ
jgi:hypothetical protein